MTHCLMNVPLLPIQATMYSPLTPPADSASPFHQGLQYRKRLKECTVPSICSYLVTESATAKEREGRGGRRTRRILCPYVTYFKGTHLPHCEHILVYMWCTYIFLSCHPFQSPPKASMAFSALFPTLFPSF